jgi:hypothetical protein
MAILFLKLFTLPIGLGEMVKGTNNFSLSKIGGFPANTTVRTKREQFVP